MKIPINIKLTLNRLLEQFIPPVIRDSYWFMKLPMILIFREESETVMNFKSKVFSMSAEEYSEIYRRVGKYTIAGNTDANTQSIHAIRASISGKSVIDVGCGNGYIAGLLSSKYKSTGVDIHISSQTKEKYKDVMFVEAKMEKLPFKDKSFDTVVSTHTLEHIPDIFAALKELRRIGRKRLLIVVPRERPYKYTFNLHVHFFPYEFSLRFFVGNKKNSVILDMAGDWFYLEEL